MFPPVSGTANHSTYLIVVTAADGSGNVGVNCCTVVVPADQSAAAIAAVDAAATQASLSGEQWRAAVGYYTIGRSS